MESRIEARRKDYKEAFVNPLLRRESELNQVRKRQRERFRLEKKQCRAPAPTPSATTTMSSDSAFDDTGPISHQPLFRDENAPPSGAFGGGGSGAGDLVNPKPAPAAASASTVGPADGTEAIAAAVPAPTPTASSSGSKSAGGIPPLSALPRLVGDCFSNDLERQLNGATGIRMLLSHQDSGFGNGTVEAVIRSGVVPRLVYFVRRRHLSETELAGWDGGSRALAASRNLEIRFEAAWAATNIAAGPAQPTSELVRQGAIAAFVGVLEETGGDTTSLWSLKDQALWGLSNIAGDSAALRNACLQTGVLGAVLRLFAEEPMPAGLLPNGAWCVSNLLRGTPLPEPEAVLPALPFLRRVLESSDEVEVQIDVLWALSYLTDFAQHEVEGVRALVLGRIVASGVCQRLVELFDYAASACYGAKLQTPALRAVGNLLTGSDAIAQHLLDCGCLVPLRTLLNTQILRGGARGATTLKKEACWALSNISAGPNCQIQALLDSGVIHDVVHILRNDEFDTRLDALWVVANAAAGGNAHQVVALVQADALPALVALLGTHNYDVLKITLDAIANILKTGDVIAKQRVVPGRPFNPYLNILDQAGGLQEIQRVAETCPNSRVQATAQALCSTFVDPYVHLMVNEEGYVELEEEDDVGGSEDPSAGSTSCLFGGMGY